MIRKKLLPYLIALLPAACTTPKFANEIQSFRNGSLEIFAQTQNPSQVMIIHSNEEESENLSETLHEAGIRYSTLDLRDEDPVAEYVFSINTPKYDTIFFIGDVNTPIKRMLYNLSQAYFTEKNGRQHLNLYQINGGNLERLVLEEE